MKAMHQRGSTVVEFALVLMMFLTFLLGVVDFSRMLYMWNAANEAARAGARYAVVCDTTGNADQVLSRMQALLPLIQDVELTWDPPACDPTTCLGVTVTIDLDYQWLSPIAAVASAIPMPSFSTYFPREVMRQDPNSENLCS